ncbi:AMP-binding protein [Neptunomonas antarctica]|uniref:Acyl-coenzyme A synthetase/AMP-(Fatty) acid ligase n=1 Tax=Neptunomonas antarctica TaxID=619304 RepID=A0A1N7IT56_9GAMM|nr:AMP-binding protein [Neptunomonas antarctica]SIS40264.1 Acyl-coenzyme A synthetase/AMP-(fatty) acid ligase [Neptunomonas antarctica]
MKKLTPLSCWLRIPPTHTIAVTLGETIAAQALKKNVEDWMRVIHSKSGARWAVFHHDSYEFLSILLALWQLQRIACVPGDNRPGTVKRLTSHVDGFIGEFPIQSVLTANACLPASESQQLPLQQLPLQQLAQPWQPLDPDAIALEIYTSGSTGEPTPISKTLAQLEREIAILESLWPTRLSHPSDNQSPVQNSSEQNSLLQNSAVKKCSVVLGTVSHQHLYGMTFRLLWPFCSGRVFETTICEYTEDILYQAHHYSTFELISSPSHLGRINTSIDWEPLKQRCIGIVSSAAPLSREDSTNVRALLDTSVREIYGSSETGAVAWRIQTPDQKESLWQSLPQINLSSTDEGTLRVTSPYLGDVNQLTLADKVEFIQPGKFRLIGRIDRIVKVEGKRVSLAAIEQQLLKNNEVRGARALTLTRTRIETAVVIQLTESAWLQLQQYGRKPLITRLKNHLSADFETVVLPRRWRFVQQLPYNLQGKIPLQTLQSMFDKEPVKWPEISAECVTDNQATLHCYIPVTLLYFDGHFAENPILPGIVQVHWAEAYGRRLLSVTGCFLSLEVIKFKSIIPPGQQITLTLIYDQETKKLSFSYTSDKGEHSSGRLCFE